MKHTLRNLWEQAAASYSDMTAVKWLEHKDISSISYRELSEDIDRIGRGLSASGYDNDHIAIIGESSMFWIASYLGIVTGNNVAVPLDAALPINELTELINRADCRGLFLSPKLADIAKAALKECPKLENIWFMTHYLPNEKNESTSKASAKIDCIYSLMSQGTLISSFKGPQEDQVCTIIFTSGTTGKSKGVMLTQRNLFDNVMNVDYTSAPGATVLSVLPIHHAYCLVMDWMKGFSLGACLCINDSMMHMIRNMNIFNPDVMLMVPLMIETIYKKIASSESGASTGTFGDRLKIIFTGGAHLEPYYIDEFEKLGVTVLEGYGMSECSPVITSNTPDNFKKGSIGKPLDNVEISFENGEILVKGSSVMKGYYKMEEETAKALKDGWLHTGDKGYLDEDGYLYINGRVKNLIIMSNGENVSPEEIENKLSLNPLVAEIIVSGENNGLTASIYPDMKLVQKDCLSEDEVKASLQTLIDHYNSNQPTYRHITKIIIRDEPFKRNTTGKIKRFSNSVPQVGQDTLQKGVS